MRRRAAGRAALAGALLAAVGVACGEAPPGDDGAAAPATPPPNIVVYLVDTLRADHLGAYGYDRPTSPQLDAFARASVLFERAYSPTSWTRPAVGTLLTGLPPSEHGAVTRSTALAPDVVSLAERLRARGYHTAAFVTNPNVLPIWGFDRGFDVFRDIESVARSATADQVNEAVFAHLETTPPEPFFLYIHTRDPHSPYAPPAPWAERFGSAAERDRYDGEIAFNDDQFGALLARLRERGLYRDSVVVFLSDHGDEFGEHGGTGHGHTLYEELVRVPLVLKLPGEHHAGQRVEAPVRLEDVVPTLLALAGAEPAPELPGRDLVARAEAPPAAEPGTQFLELSLVAPDGRKHVAEGVVLGEHKLVEVYEPDRRTLLFDLARDPGEQVPRGDADPATRDALQSLLARQRAATSGGIHVWLVADGRGEGGVARGVLTTDGRFAGLEGAALEDGDRFWLADDGRSAHFEVQLANRRNPTGAPYKLVDRDTLVVRLDPPDARLTIETATLDDLPAAIYAGAERSELGPAPQTLPVGRPALRVDHMESLFPGTRKRSIAAPAGVYVGEVAARRGSEVELPSDVDARLRALGYVE